MLENVPYLAKDRNIQIEEAEWTPNKTNLKKSEPSDIIQLQKTKKKEKILVTG